MSSTLVGVLSSGPEYLADFNYWIVLGSTDAPAFCGYSIYTSFLLSRCNGNDQSSSLLFCIQSFGLPRVPECMGLGPVPVWQSICLDAMTWVVLLRKLASLGMKWACCCCIRSSPVSRRRDATIRHPILAHASHSLAQVSWIPLAFFPTDLGWNNTSAQRNSSAPAVARSPPGVCEILGVFVLITPSSSSKLLLPSCTPPVWILPVDANQHFAVLYARLLFFPLLWFALLCSFRLMPSSNLSELSVVHVAESPSSPRSRMGALLH